MFGGNFNNRHTMPNHGCFMSSIFEQRQHGKTWLWVLYTNRFISMVAYPSSTHRFNIILYATVDFAQPILLMNYQCDHVGLSSEKCACGITGSVLGKKNMLGPVCINLTKQCQTHLLMHLANYMLKNLISAI
jgi:hypothetical protein